jgi:hypothetical protein
MSAVSWATACPAARAATARNQGPSGDRTYWQHFNPPLFKKVKRLLLSLVKNELKIWHSIVPSAKLFVFVMFMRIIAWSPE